MYLFDIRARQHRYPRFGTWPPKVIRRHLIIKDRHRTHSPCSDFYGLPGPTGSTYRKRVARELERAWQNGEITYRDACHAMEELDGEP